MKKRIILITGANRGLGSATGIKLSEQGHHVIFTARNTQKLSTLKKHRETQLQAAEANTQQVIESACSELKDSITSNQTFKEKDAEGNEVTNDFSIRASYSF